MILRLYKPCPELRHLVSRIMVNRFQLDHTQPRQTSPFPPQPEHRLYFYPYDKVLCRHYANNSISENPHSILVGPQLSRVDLTMGYNMLVVMVGFQPGGMHRLLRIPMHEVVDKPLDSTLVLGREINDVSEKLHQCTNPDDMVEIVQGYLVKKAKQAKRLLPVEEVLMQMLPHQSLLNVDQLAKKACVSVRQLERQFKERAGMPPKLFSRLVRFSNAWFMRERFSKASWLHIAHTCEYADQMHMIRDFKDFVGVTPSTLQHDLEKTSLRLQESSFE